MRSCQWMLVKHDRLPFWVDATCSTEMLALGRAGCTLCAMNKVEEAKEHFEAAIRIMPNHLEVTPHSAQRPKSSFMGSNVIINLKSKAHSIQTSSQSC